MTVVALLIIGRIIKIQARQKRPRIEKSPPALSGAGTAFMITARHHPRGRAQQRSRRPEKVFAPCIVTVSPRAVDAARVSIRAGRLAIMVVAYVNDQSGFQRAANCATLTKVNCSESLHA